MNNREIDALQTLALFSVEHPDKEAHCRKICRWYSKEFYTPLHIVENDLSFDYVMRHYYEQTFSQLANSPVEKLLEKYNEIRANILYGDIAEKRESEDDEWAEQMSRELAQAEKEDERAENPNLIDEDIDISVQGEDALPDF